MINIRVDANSKIGMGHMMRCISVAEALREEGEEVRFLVATNDATDILEQKGFAYVVLHTDFENMDSEIPVLETILCEEEKIVVDSYGATKSYFESLKKFGKVIYIDDVRRFFYPVDCVINGNIYGEEIEYNVPMELLGYRYALLKKEFVHARNNKTPEKILITTGGSDPYKMTEKIIENILKDEVLKKEQYDVVCGRFSESYETLCELSREYANFHIHKDVKEMWNLMQSAKIAITAGGTTMTELSCMGIPIVSFSFVDNQKRIVDTFYNKECAHFGGHYDELGEKIYELICKKTKELVFSDDLRNKYSEKLTQLVDGQGCQRIARQLINL